MREDHLHDDGYVEARRAVICVSQRDDEGSGAGASCTVLAIHLALLERMVAWTGTGIVMEPEQK